MLKYNIGNISKLEYSLFRLGMYRRVAEFPLMKDDWRSLYSHVLSAGACGDFDRLDFLLSSDFSKEIIKSKILDISIPILPLRPELSLQLLSEECRDSERIAVLMQLKNKDKKIKDFFYQKDFFKDPELFLFYSNFFNVKGFDQLELLNKYLSSYDLKPLRLSLNEDQLNAMSLYSKYDGDIFNQGLPLVSIIMTAFRCSKRIRGAIDSLLSQTYRNIEIIVIDDNSDDDLGDVVLEFIKNESRIKYKRLSRNIGTYGAKTIGLEFAKGEFITCQDSDDWAHPQKIELQMQPLLKNKNIVYTTSNLVRVQDDGIFYSKSIYPLMRLNSSSVLFRKSVVASETGFWDLVRTGADSEFLARLRIVFGKKRHCKINKPLTFCAHRPNSLMTSPETGSGEYGISSMRLDYWESFSQWHIETLRSGMMPMMSNDVNEKRKFYCPPDNMTSLEDFLFCKKELGLI